MIKPYQHLWYHHYFYQNYKRLPNSEEEQIDMKHRPYRELIGGLIYLANATRPDIAFAASTLSQFSTNPGRVHWLLAKRVLKYLKGILHYTINYVKSKDNLIAYTDSDCQEASMTGSHVPITSLYWLVDQSAEYQRSKHQLLYQLCKQSTCRNQS